MYVGMRPTALITELLNSYRNYEDLHICKQDRPSHKTVCFFFIPSLPEKKISQVSRQLKSTKAVSYIFNHISIHKKVLITRNLTATLLSLIVLAKELSNSLNIKQSLSPLYITPKGLTQLHMHLHLFHRVDLVTL